MKSNHSENHCRLIRKGLFGASETSRGAIFGGRNRIDFESPWVQRHIAGCTRCQRRFAHLGRVNLALSLLKSESQPLGLMTKANKATVQVLQRAVRETPAALNLKTALPNPTVFDHLRMARYQIGNLAACVSLLVLSKLGMFSSLAACQAEGKKAMEQYYAQYLDDETELESDPQESAL